MMRTALSFAFVLMLTACASGGSDGRRGGPPGGFQNGAGGEMIYGQAQRLSQEGNRAEALRAFRCAAQYGPGFEVAWHQAGVTAFALAQDPLTLEAERPGYLETGFDALAMAARTGWGASQAELARQYHSAGNIEEAAYWAAVYRSNPREDAIGLARLDSQTFGDIRSRSDYPVALERAADFFPRVLVRGHPGAGCEDFMRPVREEREFDLGLRPTANTSRDDRTR